jgi:tetratricopeptide (TPR) repeat protein
MRSLTQTAFAIIVCLAGGCILDGDDDGSRVDTLLNEGWFLFETGNFSRSQSRFQEALELDWHCADAFNGRGWCGLNMNSLYAAKWDFLQALEKGHLAPDPLAGLAIAYRDLDPADFEAAAASATSALRRDPRFVFEHDPTLDWRDLRLIMAQSYFAMGIYPLANAQVDSLDGNVQDPASLTFVEDLLREIQRLGEEIAGQ